MKRKIKGSATIEAAVVLPLVIMMFAVIITMLFYFHDKNVITGVVYEVIAIGSTESEFNQEKLGRELTEKLSQRLLMFSTIYVDVQVEKSKLILQCNAKKGGMTLQVQVAMNMTEPENYIRKIRNFQKIGNQLGETTDESIL